MSRRATNHLRVINPPCDHPGTSIGKGFTMSKTHDPGPLFSVLHPYQFPTGAQTSRRQAGKLAEVARARTLCLVGSQTTCTS